MLAPTSGYISQQRGRRRTLTPVPWLPAKKEKEGNINQNVNNKIKSLLGTVVQREALVISENSAQSLYDSKCRITDIPENSRRVGLIVRKIGMLPQWTKNGSRILCTLLEVAENHVVSVVSPEAWYKSSVVGKRKAFNRDGPMWRVSVGAVNANPTGFTTAYRKQFVKAGVPTKETIGSFLVSGDAIPTPGHPLDVRHFGVGQFVTATGKTIDWGFQGAAGCVF
uniref:Large ribosomal subunit protein uL3m n=1 Tax=Caenorhabditis japonica TaxID=281687 RepID=A0A8R1ILK2_CAEJA